MLNLPPRERQYVSWAYVVAWSLTVFATIPFARTIQRLTYHYLDRTVFTIVVVAAVVLSLAAAVGYLRRSLGTRHGSYIWLTAVAAIITGYSFALRNNPEEAVHFIEFGILSLLIYRALCHTMKDPEIYLAAAVIGALIGMIDEAIQWLTPGRVWDLRDIWINFFLVVLIQVAIAGGAEAGDHFGPAVSVQHSAGLPAFIAPRKGSTSSPSAATASIRNTSITAGYRAAPDGTTDPAGRPGAWTGRRRPGMIPTVKIAGVGEME